MELTRDEVAQLAVGTIHVPTGSDTVYIVTKNGVEVHEDATKDHRANLALIESLKEKEVQE